MWTQISWGTTVLADDSLHCLLHGHKANPYQVNGQQPVEILIGWHSFALADLGQHRLQNQNKFGSSTLSIKIHSQKTSLIDI